MTHPKEWKAANWEYWAEDPGVPHKGHGKECTMNQAYYYLIEGKKLPIAFPLCNTYTQHKILETIMLGIIENDSPTSDHSS